MKRTKRATFLQVLEFVNKRDVVIALDLMEQYGYTHGGAVSTLCFLKRQGFIINDRRGEWVITDKGTARLIYYGRA